MSSSADLGRLLGSALKSITEQNQDFTESEEVTSLNLVSIDTVKVSDAKKITKRFVVGCSISGVNGGLDPFVINHPVKGVIDSPDLYIDGDYCSSEVFYDNTVEPNTFFLVDESSNFVVDESGNYVIGIF